MIEVSKSGVNIDLNELSRAQRRRIKRKESRTKIKDKFKKQRFMKLIIIFLFVLTIVFTAVSFTVFIITGGNEPSSLVTGFFDFVKWEAGGLSLIKIAESFSGPNNKKKTKFGEIMDDGADILDNTAELVRDTNDMLHGDFVEDSVTEETEN